MINAKRLNEARWIACNRRYPPKELTLEWATELADDVVRTYLGLLPEEWEEQLPEESK